MAGGSYRLRWGKLVLCPIDKRPLRGGAEAVWLVDTYAKVRILIVLLEKC